jgi:hypothetical protein
LPGVQLQWHVQGIRREFSGRVQWLVVYVRERLRTREELLDPPVLCNRIDPKLGEEGTERLKEGVTEACGLPGLFGSIQDRQRASVPKGNPTQRLVLLLLVECGGPTLVPGPAQGSQTPQERRLIGLVETWPIP